MEYKIKIEGGIVTMEEPEPVPFWKTAEFWTLLVDVVINILMYVLTETVDAKVVEMVQYIVLQLQPLVLVVIGGLFAARQFAAHSRRQAAARVASK